MRAYAGRQFVLSYDGLWYDPTGGEPTTYRMRGGYANYTKPTRRGQRGHLGSITVLF